MINPKRALAQDLTSPIQLICPVYKGNISEAEWDLRVQLAANYRLCALYGWTDLVFTHISVRLPDEDGEERFLIDPYGLMFDEMAASSLVKIDLDGNICQETSYSSIRRASLFIRPSTPRVTMRIV